MLQTDFNGLSVNKLLTRVELHMCQGTALQGTERNTNQERLIFNTFGMIEILNSDLLVLMGAGEFSSIRPQDGLHHPCQDHLQNKSFAVYKTRHDLIPRLRPEYRFSNQRLRKGCLETIQV